MAINKNHEFEELEGIKCAVVERNIALDRAEFLKELLVNNGYTVVIVPAPPPKATAKPAPKSEENITDEETAEISNTPELFVLGVTDLAFNSINAIFGRMLRLPDGNIVTQAYWNQELNVENLKSPYYEHTRLADKQPLSAGDDTHG